MTITWTRAWMAVAAVMLSASLAHADIGDNTTGINVHVPFGSPHLLDKAASTGAQWVRVDGNWELFEGRGDVPDVPVNQRNPNAPFNEGQYTWEVMDQVVCDAARRDLDVFMTLAYTPCWAVEGGVNCNDPNRGYVGFRKPIPGKYDAFVFAAVRHYSSGIDCGQGLEARVTHFGMWNEANLPQFYENSDVADYRDRVLIPGARAVKAACPDCKVLGPDLANVGDDADDHLETILCNAQARGAIDILAHHSYNSFQELGHFIWDGDSYDNVLDEQRFVFTRRSVRQIMEACQATDLEVWMTETGRRAPGSGPFDNPMFEDDLLEEQALYISLVLQAQARRPWVTATFLYEIADDTFSDIDGFGLWRCAQTPSLQEPCFEKPAVQAMRDFIDDHPDFTQDGPPPLPACNNNLDDDEDGLIDFPDDPGCDSADDIDEFNPLPPRTLEVPEARTLLVDGRDTEYGDGDAQLLGSADFVALEAPNAVPMPQDLSASIRARRFGDRIGFFVTVVDDTHDNTHGPANIWQGDSVQIAFDPERNGGEGYSGDDAEIGIALVDGQVITTAFVGAAPGLDAAVRREGNQTFYEFSVPLSVLFGRNNPGFGDEARASLLINEADGAGREGWLAFGGGIGRFKRPDDFARLLLVDGADDPDPDPMPDMMPDPNPQPDPNPGMDPDPNPGMNPDPTPDPMPDAGMPDDVGDPEPTPQPTPEPGAPQPVPEPAPSNGGNGGGGCQTPLGAPSGAWWWLVGAIVLLRRRQG